MTQDVDPDPSSDLPLDAEQLPIGSHDVSYVHYWDSVQERIALISAASKLTLNRDTPTQLWGDNEDAGDRGSQLDEDITIAAHAAAATRKAFTRGRRFLLMANFRFATLNNRRARQKLASCLDQLPTEVRSYFVLRLIRVPSGTPAAALVEVISFARALTPHVCLQATPTMLTGDFLHGSGSSGISLSAGDSLTAKRGTPPTEALAQMIRQARRITKTVIVDGVNDHDQFTVCNAGAVRFLAGPLIVKPCDSIIGPLPMPRDKVISHIAII